MIEIPIRYKEVKYPKNIGSSRGGFYTSAFMIIDEKSIKFIHKKYKFFKYFANQLPLFFLKEMLQPEEFYINKFGEYKVKYETHLKKCEITFKISKINLSDKEKNILDNWFRII